MASNNCDDCRGLSRYDWTGQASRGWTWVSVTAGLERVSPAVRPRLHQFLTKTTTPPPPISQSVSGVQCAEEKHGSTKHSAETCKQTANIIYQSFEKLSEASRCRAATCSGCFAKYFVFPSLFWLLDNWCTSVMWCDGAILIFEEKNWYLTKK